MTPTPSQLHLRPLNLKVKHGGELRKPCTRKLYAKILEQLPTHGYIVLNGIECVHAACNPVQ